MKLVNINFNLDGESSSEVPTNASQISLTNNYQRRKLRSDKAVPNVTLISKEQLEIIKSLKKKVKFSSDIDIVKIESYKKYNVDISSDYNQNYWNCQCYIY
jgi:hypothetical protein